MNPPSHERRILIPPRRRVVPARAAQLPAHPRRDCVPLPSPRRRRRGLRTGAFFYPQTSDRDLSRLPAGTPFQWNESQEVQRACPLFSGHDQPRTYTIDDGSTTTWDDADPGVMRQQVRLAESHGLDFFVFDSYVGTRNGLVVREMSKPVDAFLENPGSLKLAQMFVLESPRVRLPFASNLEPEPGRPYDLCRATALEIRKEALLRWQHPFYLTLGGRPVVLIMANSAQIKEPAMVDVLEVIRGDRAPHPFVILILRRLEDLDPVQALKPDGVTGYAYLPDFGSHAEPIQDYDARVAAVGREWEMIQDRLHVPFLPPAVCGWDASPRGRRDLDWTTASAQRVYPFVPVVQGACPDAFATMLDRAAEFTEWSTRNHWDDEGILLVTAWNEIGEGCALLPRVLPGNQLDDGWLRALAPS